MHAMDDLLHLLHSDGADQLRLRVGRPPILVLDREEQELESPVISMADAERLLEDIADTRQRRELREQGRVEFIYKFRNRASFVIRAWMDGENVALDIH